MNHSSANVDTPGNNEKPLSIGELIVRVLWMTLQLILVVWLAQRGAFFFYQGF